jgi:hypothetical protein
MPIMRTIEIKNKFCLMLLKVDRLSLIALIITGRSADIIAISLVASGGYPFVSKAIPALLD